MSDTIFKVGFIIFDVLVLIFLILYLLVAYLKGWKRTLLNLCAFLIPFIIYLFMSDTIAKMVMHINIPQVGSIYDLVFNSIKEAVGPENNMQEETIKLCESLSIAIVRFGTYYACLLICLLIAQINRIIFRFAFRWFVYPGGDRKVRPSGFSRLLGLGVGFVRFIFASVILFFPIYGIINLADTGLKDYALISELTSENNAFEEVSESSVDYEKIRANLNGSISYKIFTLTKNTDTELSIPAEYLGTILKIRTDTGSYNLVKEYGNVHAMLRIVSRMDISDDYVSFEKLTEDDVKTLHKTIGKTKLLKLFAPMLKEIIINELEKEQSETEVITVMKDMDASAEADILLKAVNELFNILVGLKINVNQPEDLLLEKTLVTTSKNLFTILLRSKTIQNYAIPKLSNMLIEKIDDKTGEMNKVVSTRNLELCFQNDISKVLMIYQQLATSINLHNFIFYEEELVINTDAAANAVENAIDELFNLTIVRGNESIILRFVLTKAEQDNLSYDILFKDLNPQWQEEGKTIGKIVKEIILLPEEAKDFENFSIDKIVLKDANGEYVYKSLINEVSKSNLFRVVIVNLIESFENDEQNKEMKEILDLLNIENIRNISTNGFYNELIGLLQIIDILIDTNILDEEKAINLTEANIEELITRLFGSVIVKGKEQNITEYLLDKTDVNDSLTEMGITLNIDNVNWETEPDKLIEIFKALLAFGDITTIDFATIIATRDDTSNPKIVKLFSSLRDSDIFGEVIFDMMDKMVEKEGYTDITNLFNLRSLSDLPNDEFEKEILNLLDIIDIIEQTNITSGDTLNITEANIEELITKLFGSVITEGKEPDIFDYMIEEFGMKTMLQNQGVKLNPYDPAIDWKTEPDKLVVVFKSLLAFGKINEIDFAKLMFERNETTKANLITLLEALDDSEIFSPHIYIIIENMTAEAGYAITLTEEEKEEIRTNGWSNEVNASFDTIDKCDTVLDDSSKYLTVEGTVVKDIMLSASSSVIASKILGGILNTMLGRDYLNINPEDENGNYKYDFTNRQVLKDNAESIGKLIDVKHAINDKTLKDENVTKSIEAIKALNNDEFTKDILNVFVDGRITTDLSDISFENEGKVIEDVYTEYNKDRNNFNIIDNPELKQKVEESDIAKYILEELGII